MRIGLFSDTFPPELNGVANSTYILRNALERNGHEVFVITTRAGSGKAEWDEDHKVLRLAGVELKFLYGYVLTTPFHINAYNMIKELKLDVIHAQTEFGVGIFARICAHYLNVPLVSTYHTTYEDYTHYVNFVNSKTVDSVAKKLVGQLSKLYGDSSIEVISPSEKTKEMLIGYGIRREIRVIPTGLELERFQPEGFEESKRQEIRSSFGFQPDDVVIVYVGRIATEKALDIVLKGFAKAKEDGVPVKGLIIGDGPQAQELKDLAKSLNLDDTVIFAGKRPSKDVPDYYRSSDAFISASLTETQGMTFIEAMASGLPVFARKDEVLADLVLEGKTGYYFSDEEGFSKKAQEFLRLASEQRKTMKEACIKQVEPYSSQVFYESVIQVYESAIEKYSHMYIIDDIAVKGDVMQLFITNENADEDIRVLISLEKYALDGYRKGGRLNFDELKRLQAQEVNVKAYQSCIRRIATKDRTRKEIYDWLTQNTECDIENINQIVDRLEEKGYINDNRYCEESITSMKLALQGEEKIIRDLKKKGIPYEMIEEKLQERTNDEQSNALEYAQKVLSSQKEMSTRMKQKTLKTKLLQRGYSMDVTETALQEVDFAQDGTKELEALRKCATKARKRYERKYNGTQLRNRIYRYCATQGFSGTDIYVILDEMEWKDEED